MMQFRILLILCFSLTATGSSAQTISIRDDLLSIFTKHEVNGTFVTLDTETEQLTLIGSDRAKRRFIPASTFKIVNSLIALETASVADEDDVIPFGGKPQPFKVWEQDMSIRDGIKVSNVPVFQEIARRVGLNRYIHFLKEFDYGNQMVGNDVETFWLKGPLKISAIETVRWLRKLAKLELPASRDNQKVVHEIIRLETNNDRTLYGKTGWTLTPDPDIGWFVGWVEHDGRKTAFALNLDIYDRYDANKRVILAKELLTNLELL